MDDFFETPVDPATGFKENEKVVHPKHGDGRLICTIPNGKGYGSKWDRAVVHFFEDNLLQEVNHGRNVFLNEISKVEEEVDNQ